MQLFAADTAAREVGILMNQELYNRMMAIMASAGLPEDSSAELAFHVALHFPEHGAALIDVGQVDPEEPEAT